ncbi:pyocin S6 family toxin immunity protein [Pseudomonas lutea]|jgi:hypothetical protein|uniref:Uncharacterized protein n=1 Tax=Pseudomonas lutea TaxID=243924 RepID=A0A9X0JKP4_9PSED|nr:pyocin S6 family toxin immunity protein [Pseudomonas lutea]KGF66150.1 hypothetical protein LT42_09720 [Pseudomonas lutea]
MTFLLLTGFFPEPNPDSSLQFEKDIPSRAEPLVLNVMGWASKQDVPSGEHDLTAPQAAEILSILGEPFRDELIYGIGLCRA